MHFNNYNTSGYWENSYCWLGLYIHCSPKTNQGWQNLCISHEREIPGGKATTPAISNKNSEFSSRLLQIMLFLVLFLLISFLLKMENDCSCGLLWEAENLDTENSLEFHGVKVPSAQPALPLKSWLWGGNVGSKPQLTPLQSGLSVHWSPRVFYKSCNFFYSKSL